MARKKWYDVTVVESYHATYKIKAGDMHEAEDIANELVNSEMVDPTADCPDSYERCTWSGPVDAPTEPGTVYWEYRDGRPCAREAGRKKAKARKGARK